MNSTNATPAVGAELDALVAEKVMGMVPCGEWAPTNFGSAGGAALIKQCSHENGKCWPTTVLGHMAGPVGGCPPFSKDISRAWMVADKMRELEYEVIISSRKKEWACSFVSGATFVCSTAQLAICVAALETIGYVR